MNFSLRTKLLLMVGCAVIFTALPVNFFSRNHITGRIVEHETAEFANTLSLVEDGLNVRYLHLLTSEVESVLQAKRDLSQYALLLSEILTPEHEAWADLILRWQHMLAADDFHLAVFDRQGEPVVKDRLIERATAEGRLDFKKQSLREMTLLQSRKDGKGQYAVAKLDKGRTPVLLFFMPVRETWVLALAMPIINIETGRKLMKERMITVMRARIDSLERSYGAAITLYDEKGEVLAGEGGILSLDSLPPEVLAKARKGTHVEGVTEDKSLLYRVSFFNALDWYAIASIPMSSISGPAKELTSMLLIVSGAILAAILLFTLLLTMKMLTPLRLLAKKAGSIAMADFSSEEGSLLAETAEGLPVEQKDEVGQLALSFVNMARALSQNIKKLVEATAASQRMLGELAAAREIQMGILPPPESAPGGGACSVSVLLHSAKEVGGDLYDFFTAPDGRQVVVVGDVSDKGVPAALFMSMTVTLVRYAIADGLSCADAMARINDRLAENNPSCMFVTLFIGLFDPATGVLDYASGAHCPPFAVEAGEGTPVRKLAETSGPLVGAMPGMEFKPCRAVLGHGEYCLLYTDGVSEAMNKEQELFGEDRIGQVLEGLHGAGVEEVIRKVMQAVEEHRGMEPQSDDITMLCFKRT
ncbi:MAG: SpoIIE family protein phosphatase [Mailhella sp.]|jgi:sigma-B regulation protein RsbU (phosphoserine phosphatase)|nr:SpoIIE family protein phosphatase [Mailhella sp.]